jgi:hypothetical protein
MGEGMNRSRARHPGRCSALYNPHQHMARNFLALVKSIEREGEYPLTKEAISERCIDFTDKTSFKDLLDLGLRAEI